MKTMKHGMAAQQLLDMAAEAFRPRPTSPGTPIDKIMYEAGAQAVLSWMRDKIKASEHVTSVVVPTAEAEMPDSTEGFLRRISRGAA